MRAVTDFEQKVTQLWQNQFKPPKINSAVPQKTEILSQLILIDQTYSPI